MENINSEELKQLIKDVALLKEILLSSVHREDSEGELSDWAKAELEVARKTPISQYISHEEVKKRIFHKK